MSTRW